jgi:hypothetical protein
MALPSDAQQRILDARQRLLDAERELTSLLGQLEVTRRADKKMIGDTLRTALSKVADAQVALVEVLKPTGV